MLRYLALAAGCFRSALRQGSADRAVQDPCFDAFYWWRAHHWYFTPDSLRTLLRQLGREFEVHPGQRYDLSNICTGCSPASPEAWKIQPPVSANGARVRRRPEAQLFCDHLIAIVS